MGIIPAGAYRNLDHVRPDLQGLEETEQALAVMQNYPEGKNTAVMGCIQEKGYALVKMKTLYGNYRIVDMLSGEQLPRI